jgi:DUF1680 family protein
MKILVPHRRVRHSATANFILSIVVVLSGSIFYSRDLAFAQQAEAPASQPQTAPLSVEAGVDRVVVLGGKTYLRGKVRSDGASDAGIEFAKSQWRKESGPGEVIFADETAPVTTAMFSNPGDYSLKLTANLGAKSASDSLKVKVVPAPNSKPLEPVETLPYQINSPLWNDRFKSLIVHWMPHCIAEVSDPELRQGGISNLIEAGKKLRGEPAKPHVGAPFANAWVFNTLEAMCLAQMVDPAGDADIRNSQALMRAKIEEWIPIIIAAQEPDGYLQTRFTLGIPQDKDKPREHWNPRTRGEHEGYVAGYFLEAAIAHYNMTDGKDRRLYDAAKKLADCWYNNLGPSPKKTWFDGHQEMEQALVRFARLVDRVEGAGQGQKYVELAKFLIDSRRGGSPYDQSHLPAVQQYEAVGHAVRAGYLYSGMADIAMLAHDLDYQSAVCSLCDNIVNKKYYVTGGIGSGETSEGFGPNYSLRNTGYCESCSGTGELFFQYKMNLMLREAKYADLFEETLFNAILGDIDLDGNNFYYQNPLETDGTSSADHPERKKGFRTAWHACPCCVSNISRTLLMLPTWMYATDSNGLYVNLFAGSTVDVGQIAGTDVQVVQTTNYPWDGKVALTINPQEPKQFSLYIRAPQRQTSELYSCTPADDGIAKLLVNGENVSIKISNGYAVIDRLWRHGDKVEIELPIVPQRVKAVEQIAADRGRIALRYGPLVYNFEAADNPGIEADHPPILKSDSPLQAEWQPDLLHGVVVIKAQSADGSTLTAIPNFARNNRQGYSAVWILDQASSAPKEP